MIPERGGRTIRAPRSLHNATRLRNSADARIWLDGSAAGQHHRERPDRLRRTHDPLRQPDLPGAVISSAANQASNTNWTAATAPAQPAGRSAHGTDGPRRRARPCRQSSEPERCPQRMRDRTTPGMLRNAATSMPRARARDQDQPASRRVRAQRRRGDDIADPDYHEDQRHDPPVSRADSRERTDVSATWLKDGSCSMAATVHPAISSTDDAAPETTPTMAHPRTITRVGSSPPARRQDQKHDRRTGTAGATSGRTQNGSYCARRATYRSGGR